MSLFSSWWAPRNVITSSQSVPSSSVGIPPAHVPTPPVGTEPSKPRAPKAEHRRAEPIPKKRRPQKKDTHAPSRRGPTHATAKWRKPEISEDAASCCVCHNGSGHHEECPECARKFCERVTCNRRGGVPVINLCFQCGVEACCKCRNWVTAPVLSQSWRGEERYVEFCSRKCCDEALERCQRSQNPIVTLF